MKQVYTADSVPMAWHMANVLEYHGIQALVKNDKLYSVAGEIPFIECLPEVWVQNDLDYIRAGQIIKELESTAKNRRARLAVPCLCRRKRGRFRPVLELSGREGGLWRSRLELDGPVGA